MNTRTIKLIQASPYLAVLHAHRNFTKAAEVLGVHQTAVSHRMRALEDMLGFKLFERTTRSLSFTLAGEILCSAAHNSTSEMERALARVITVRESNTIRVSVPPSLAMKWMVPMMGRAKAAGIEISVQAESRLVDFTRGEADVSVRYGLGPYAGVRTLSLGTSYMQPLASPGYIKENGIDPEKPWAKPLDMLIDEVTEMDHVPFGWKQLQEADVRWAKNASSISRFDRTDLALQGAINGLGVALGRSMLYETDVKNGFLIPLGPAYRVEPSDWLVCSYEFATSEKYKAFAKWLVDEVANTHKILAEHGSP